MLNTLLYQIQKRSELVLPSMHIGDVPNVSRNLDHLNKQCESMNERIKPTQELHARAHYFLTRSGINTQDCLDPIDTRNFFYTTEKEINPNIERFLEEEHERMLIEIIEEKRRETNELFDEFYETKTDILWKNTEQENKEAQIIAMDMKEFEGFNLATRTNIMKQYNDIITDLNNHRMLNIDYNIIAQLSKVQNSSYSERSQSYVMEAWDILNHLVTKSSVEGRLEGRFTESYAAQPYSSFKATQTRRSLIESSKTWLEKQMGDYINETLLRNAPKIMIGGNPSIIHRLKSFINFTFKTSSGWADNRLEVVDELPIWIFIFLLIRSGHIDLAYKFMKDNEGMFHSDRSFITYFEQYMNAPLHCVPEATQMLILNEYHRLLYGEVECDPYKLILYKIIGRCELHNLSMPGIIKTVEDYIWLQLMLVREVLDTEKYAFERYRLVDLQKHVSSYGSQWFDTSDSPWTYFKILLLTLQFEEAIDHVYKINKYRIETVHFAISLVYVGLLKVTPSNLAPSLDLIMKQGDDYIYNFPRLICQYIRVYNHNSPKDALQYLLLLTLYSTKQGYLNDDMLSLARSYVCEYVLLSNDFKALLGHMEGNRMNGLIDGQRELLGIQTENDYIEKILHPVGKLCVQNGRCIDAVYAYNLASDYSSVINVLATQLSEALKQSQVARSMDPTLSELSNEEIIQFSVDTMAHYERYQHMKELIDERQKTTIRTLIQLLQFRSYYEKDLYEQALQIIEETQVIPLKQGYNYIQLAADQFEQLDDTIKSNIPQLLLNVMDILYKKWVAYSEPNASFSTPITTLKAIEENVRAVLTFVGIIQFSIPSDIVIRLNKIDMIMTEKKRS
ncbi:Nup93/Nic96-domain-containing protein [Pilobolus umbonatus]|nr:Nup93/Nic96-domain-containing protein [Pilobolus umbonatus]